MSGQRGMIRGGGLLNFYRHIEITDTCWLWTGGTNRTGYGRGYFRGRMISPHRLVYEIVQGDLIPGMSIDHLCSVRLCVRPDHLEQVSFKTNTARGSGASTVNRLKTHCVSGHEFTEENTYVYWRGRGCRTCRKAQHVVSNGRRRERTQSNLLNNNKADVS